MRIQYQNIIHVVLVQHSHIYFCSRNYNPILLAIHLVGVVFVGANNHL